MPDPSPYIPSLERARAARVELLRRVWWRRGPVDLLAKMPRRTEQVAAVVVLAAPDPALAPSFRYTYVPEMRFELHEGITALLDPWKIELPEALRFSIEREQTGAPYRSAPVAPSAFRGFDLGNALTSARSTVGALRREHGDRAAIQTFAWPILVLRFGWLRMTDVALLVRPDGDLQAFVARG